MLSTLRVASRSAAAKEAGVRALAFRQASTWSNVPQGPPITEAFKADTNKEKINLGVGAYRDDQGKPYVLPSVKVAETKVVNSSLDKEYAGITGVPAFTKAAAELAYGADSSAIKDGRVAITQSISGTGALRIGGAFLERFYPHGKTIYIPTPSWANHAAVFKDSGLKVEKYRYYNKDKIGLDFEGLIADLKQIPNQSVVLFHACAHNPTGVDPTQEQWIEISKVMKEKSHFAFFDMAYQGFASGDIKRDAFALRHFWLGEVKGMADRIIEMRALLRKNLEKLGSKHDWSHITNQIGMFAYTGLKPEQMQELAKNHAVYATLDGRISVAGITTSNVARLAESIYKVTG
ncbi:aspartate aminotransferase [Uncinocarpus reesii 1704]|uniref:aspartate transaminase n=1 Tax=Uncinocarpus reesii (strain UAMH 1704) TaxID=336963 RepID=C4JRQ5_UNCRE|nr:aspartate aminotransferase [Uncinocarpus reesii 1704]EEP80302.1 aspartate aminotransferase [Uncinocarpus reesii 1704]